MANYTIINDDELAVFIAELLIISGYRRGPHWHFCNKIYASHYNGTKPVYNSSKHKERIEKAVKSDCDRWRDKIIKEKRTKWKFHKRKLVHFVLKNLEKICSIYGHGNHLKGKRLLLSRYLDSPFDGYMKQLSNAIYNKPSYRTKETYTNIEKDCLIRNILNNEVLLKNKIDNKFPFWFVDSGYTNFTRTSGIKIYHRLCRSDIHAEMPKHIFPMNRLLQMIFDNRGLLNGFKFPRHWRTGGDTIIIIPPSEHICAIGGLNQDSWVKAQTKKLTKLTDKKIIVRTKTGSRKTRTSLYDDLLDDESVYCVVGYNSNALTEAVWAGVPIITLGKHVTNPVSRNSLDKIDNLYRDDVSQWLCYLSYSQFTNEELLDGTAKEIMETWHV